MTTGLSKRHYLRRLFRTPTWGRLLVIVRNAVLVAFLVLLAAILIHPGVDLPDVMIQLATFSYHALPSAQIGRSTARCPENQATAAEMTCHRRERGADEEESRARFSRDSPHLPTVVADGP